MSLPAPKHDGHCVVPAAEFEAAVGNVVRYLDNSAGGGCHAALKKLIEQQRQVSVTKGLDLELDAFRRLWDETHAVDALRRFLARRVGS